MNRKSFLAPAVTMALLACHSASQAAVLLAYDFTISDLNPSFQASNVTGGTFNLQNAQTGISWNGTIGDNSGAPSGFGFSTTTGNVGATNALLQNTSRNNAIDANDYISFTITPTAGYTLSLDVISFKAATRDATAGPANKFALLSTQTGFTTAATSLLAGTVGSLNTTNTGTYFSFSVDVSEVSSFQNLTTTTEFRIYIWGGGSSPSNSRVNYDNFGVTGSTELIIVPEPSMLTLSCVAFGALLIRRRR
jgi:hypothetical protein